MSPDGLDRLTQETSPQGAVSYQYDVAGRRQTVTATGQAVVNYTFDNADRLTQVAQGTTTLGFGYDAASRRTSVTLPNGIVGTFGFDNANQLTGITYKNGSTQVGTLTYGYDAGGRRTSVGGTLAGFVPPNYVASLTYDGTNRLTNWGGTSLTYDANGNLTGFGGTTYTWNARNQLTAASAGSASFAYDAFGRRVSASVNGSTTPYLYDGLNPVTMSGNLLLASAKLDEIFAQVGSSSASSYLRDGLNSTVALTSSTASISANYYYSPYGDSAETGSASTPLQFTGRENDGATGLYFYRARYYSPQLARFISEDPIGINGGANFYAYVGGDPISMIDPKGLEMGPAYAAIYRWDAGINSSSAVPWKGNFMPMVTFTQQDNVCTLWPARLANAANSNPRVLACCQTHDACYTTNLCNISSWIGNAFPLVSEACQRCNSVVKSCIIDAVRPHPLPWLTHPEAIPYLTK